MVKLTARTVLYTRRFTDTIEVTKRIVDTTNIGDDTEICEGDQATFTITNVKDRDVLWSDSSNGVTATFDRDGPVWGKVYNSCNETKDSVYLTVYPKLVTDFPTDTVVCMRDSVVLNVGNFLYTDYDWENGAGDSSIVVYENGSYVVRLYNKCFSGTFSFNVYFEDELHGFRDVNIFTPNNDGVNDVFEIYRSVTDYFDLQIFNRWGKRVYQVNDYQSVWKANRMPDGVYFYSVRFKNCLGELMERRGSIAVQR